MKNLTPHLWSSTLVAMRPSPTLEENPCREYQVLRAEFGEMSPRGLSNDLTESKTNVKAIINNFMDTLSKTRMPYSSARPTLLQSGLQISSNLL
jgi:hypothetical protein